MNENNTTYKKIAILRHPNITEGKGVSAEIKDMLEERGLTVVEGELTDQDIRQQVTNREFDLAITLGGDGTVLRAGHLCAPIDLPVLAVNMGSFGFLIEVNREDVETAIENILKGEFWIEKRMMLEASHWRAEECLGRWQVVNEVVISRGYTVRPVHLTAHLDDRRLTTYVTDALIVSTPTGSTAYAMAAGGPILPPELRNILLVPVAPHLSMDRALVLSEGAVVSIEVRSNHQAISSVDGKAPVDLLQGDRIMVTASEHIFRFIRFQQPDYFYRNLISLMAQHPSVEYTQ